jgi:hypothetical protein
MPFSRGHLGGGDRKVPDGVLVLTAKQGIVTGMLHSGGSGTDFFFFKQITFSGISFIIKPALLELTWKMFWE